MQTRLVVLGTIVALAATACSSTAQSDDASGVSVVDETEDSSAAAAAAEAAAGETTDEDGTSSAAAPDAPASPGSGPQPGASGQRSDAPGDAAPATTEEAPTAVDPSEGADEAALAPVEIGAMYVSNGQAFLEAFGVSGGATLDTKAAHEALVAAINADGGMGGHPVDLVLHELDATSTESYSSLAQKACVAFTEDHDAIAVAGATFQMIHCLADHGAIGVDNADNIGGSAFMREVDDYYYSTSSMNYDRKAAAWLTGLDATGYLDEGGTFGLIHYDVPGMPESVDTVIEPDLAERGIELEVRVEVTFPDSTSEAGGTVAQIQNAVLQFQSRGVDHALIYDVNATMPVFFMQQAESQGYRPRYGLETDSHLNFMLQNVPASQLVDSVAVGWRPIDDQLQRVASTPSELRCRSILEEAGIEIADHSSLEAAMNVCDWWFFLDHVYDRMGGAIDVPTFAATVEGMGSAYASPRTFSTSFSPGRTHDGAAEVQPLAYDEDCPCYVPTGGTIRIL